MSLGITHAQLLLRRAASIYLKEFYNRLGATSKLAVPQ